MTNKGVTAMEYQPKWDAETLIEAEFIKQDKQRFDAAWAEAQKIAKERAEKAVAIQKAVSSSPQSLQKNSTPLFLLSIRKNKFVSFLGRSNFVLAQFCF